MRNTKRRRDGSRAAPTRLPLSSLIGEKSGLYVVYCHGGGHSPMDLYSVYALDVSNICDDGDDVKPLPKPLLRLNSANYPDDMSFASLGSKIYLIGGRFEGRTKELRKLSSAVYVYDTKEKLFKNGPPMKAGKSSPIVVTIFDKIYVISSSPAKDPKPIAEVFNPIDDSWTTLPGLTFRTRHPEYHSSKYDVEAHAVHGSTIFLSTRKRGIYCLDVNEPSAWQKVDLLGGVNRFPFHGGAEFVHEIWFATGGHNGEHNIHAYDITTAGNDGFVKELKLLDVEPKFNHLHALVDWRVVDLGDGKLGLIRSGLDDSPYKTIPVEARVYITLDVFQVANSLFDSHSSRFNRLYSSTYVMDDNPAVWGYLGACFLI